MPYVKRDAEGKITAVFKDEAEDGLEAVDTGDPELAAFLSGGGGEVVARQEFADSDLGMARVFEDVIDILIERGVFLFQDLPEQAQQKLLSRRGLRKEFAYVEDLFGAGEDELIEGGEDSLI